MLVAGQRQLRLQCRLVEPFLLLEVEGVRGQEARWRQAHQCGRGRHQHHVEVAVLVRLQDAPQRGQPLGDQVLVRREGVVGQRLPVREHRDSQLGREEGQLTLQALGVGGFGRDDGRQSLLGGLCLGMSRQQQRVGRADGAGQGVALAWGDRGCLHS
jgi:hypothetical protein